MHHLFTMNNVLAIRNQHARDKNILFAEEGHKYTITSDPGSQYTSVTTCVHSHFPKFDSDAILKSMMKGKNWKEGHKYWGLTAEQIKQQWADNGAAASQAGTDLHYRIECFMNNVELPAAYTHTDLYKHYQESNAVDNGSTGGSNTPLEWKYFTNFVKHTTNLKPYRTEWTVYHEDLKLAGSIDMVYENPDGTLSIYDWKRAKDITRVNMYKKYATTECICHMPDSNFWHYTLQLNIYKAILEAKYGKIVTDLYLIRLHPDAEEENYEIIQVPIVNADIKNLFDERQQIMAKTA